MVSQEFKQIAVLGSNSFSGASFIQYLLENTDAEVLAISRSPEAIPTMNPYLYQRGERPKRVKFFQLDINRNLNEIMKAMDQHKPELVVNYAAQGEVRNSWKWPEQWYETNCLGVVRLSEALRRRDYLRRYVAISTPEVYGSTEGKIKEGHHYYPSTPYGASKLAGDLHLFALFKRYDFPVVFIRAANVYGRHQQLYRIIPKTIISIVAGTKLELHGGGRSLRSFIHIHDVVDATYRAASCGKSGDIYHIAPESKPISIASVVQKICNAMAENFNDRIEITQDNFGQDSMYFMDSQKARQELDWQTSFSLEKGIGEMVEWIQSDWGVIKKLSHTYDHIHN